MSETPGGTAAMSTPDITAARRSSTIAAGGMKLVDAFQIVLQAYCLFDQDGSGTIEKCGAALCVYASVGGVCVVFVLVSVCSRAYILRGVRTGVNLGCTWARWCAGLR